MILFIFLQFDYIIFVLEYAYIDYKVKVISSNARVIGTHYRIAYCLQSVFGNHLTRTRLYSNCTFLLRMPRFLHSAIPDVTLPE